MKVPCFLELWLSTKKNKLHQHMDALNCASSACMHALGRYLEMILEVSFNISGMIARESVTKERQSCCDLSKPLNCP